MSAARRPATLPAAPLPGTRGLVGSPPPPPVGASGRGRLPSPPRELHGRRAETAALDRILDRPTALAVISGPAGIGKTALALSWLNSHGPFPDGQVHASFCPGRSESVRDVLGRWLRALSVPPDWIPADVRDRAALWRSLAAGRRMAVLIDNAPSSAAIGALLPEAGPAVVIATAREKLPAAAASGAHFVHLGPLPASAAVALIGDVAGHHRVAAEPRQAAELARLCGGNPLSLRTAAGSLAISPDQPVARAAAVLAGLGPGPGPRGRTSAAAEFRLAYEMLTVPAARACRLLSLCPGPDFTPGLAAAALAASPAATRAVLSELTAACLLEEADGRFRFHDLLRGCASAAAGHEEPGSARRDSAARVTAWYLHHAAGARLLLQPPRSAPRDGTCHAPAGAAAEFCCAQQATDWLEAERPGLRAAVQMAGELELHAAAWQLAAALRPLAQRGHDGDGLQIALAGLESARACDDKTAQALMLGQAGAALARQGRPGAAASRIVQARALWRDLGDAREAAAANRRLARLALARGEADTAIALYRKALTGFRALGDSRDTALTGVGLGRALTAAGDLGEAADLLREAVAILRDGRDPRALARALSALARALPHHPAQAAALLENALDAAGQAGAVPDQADILQTLAALAARAPAPARDLYERALGLFPAAHPRAREIQAALAKLPPAGDTE